jgi:putative flippase GtrA
VTFFDQVLAVIIGGMIALVANYFLQRHSFKEQNKTNRMNQRMIAYSDLLRELHNFRQ